MRLLRDEMFREPGRCFLDAGAGAFPHTQCSELYARHLCLDVSMAGLLTAKEKLGPRGLYVVGDLAHLPFLDGAFDGLLCAHAIYYLSRRDHRRAVAEIVRVLSDGSPGAIIYDAARNSAAFRWLHGAVKRYWEWRGTAGRLPGVRLLRGLRGGGAPAGTAPPSAPAPDPTPRVFARHLPARWFLRELASAGQEARLRGHHLLSYRLDALTGLVADNGLGRALLRTVARLEGWFPSALGTVATEVTVIFRKTAAPMDGVKGPGLPQGRRPGRRVPRERPGAGYGTPAPFPHETQSLRGDQ
jgi:SAM-dependent methyltransferase